MPDGLDSRSSGGAPKGVVQKGGVAYFLAGTWNLEPAIAMCRLIVSHPSLAIDVSCHIPAQSLQPLPGLFGQGGTQARNACPLGGGFAGFAAHGTLRLR
mmetsp:Transcript_82676/g.137938  ORF Transcript_82676/g.137938 Transcript_82676/m.137938 type:complete len:99 (+) Transcript_82676:1035-1331(+)|eukprot:CAMPEP_0174332670 /NCGR_PEP_ID=MMETSP0810-20121108/18491_1 /TAXON_ID=73025 ORGANISM="Eutreptiella gymnastica-like, Strain CCMP1594" /NCGR_SAMPLE_ID=MMETSP0810 /ASSEMBLY_ACC=CAM_ASM_000659 /LENGTH=98 /DNA_ID=CAMNT_0015449233 /DNA_START=1027 /DNA_END=1323 /DNA_ORIENTATION=-